MDYTVLTVSNKRRVTLCGTNVYPKPEPHLDRIMEEHDLLYIFSGEQAVAQDDENYILQTGDLIFLRAGSHHYGTAPCSVNMRSMFIHCNPLPGDHREAYVTKEEMGASEDTFILPTVIHCGKNNNINDLFNAIIDLFWSHKSSKERRLTLLLNLLMDELVGVALENVPQREEWSVSVISLFKENPDRIFSLEEVAERVNMNVRTLSARFREITGQSIHQYQLDLKLEAAYQDLRTGQRTVKDVAMSYGFCDAYYFSRLFKKKFGVAPKQIKEREPSANINRNPVV